VSLKCESGPLLSEVDANDGEVDFSAAEVSVLGPGVIIDDDAVRKLLHCGSKGVAFFL
jgi:hypothetical protein